MVITSKDEIIYELVNKCLRYNILILNLKEYYREVIEDKFDLIFKYKEHIFIINNTSLEKLYKNIKVKDKYNLKGIYKCNIQKYNMD